MAKNSHLDHLASIPLFSALSKKELSQVAALCSELRFPAGKTLIKQGSVGYECFVIVSGEAKIERNGQLVTIAEPGAYFGELSLLDKGPRSATVTALTDLTALVLGPREFASAIDKIPGFALKVMSVLAKRLRDMDVRVFGQ